MSDNENIRRNSLNVVRLLQSPPLWISHNGVDSRKGVDTFSDVYEWQKYHTPLFWHHL